MAPIRYFYSLFRCGYNVLPPSAALKRSYFGAVGCGDVGFRILNPIARRSLNYPRRATVSGMRNQIIAAVRKLIEARLITGARPNASANGAVISGAVMLMTRPQLKIDAAVERKWGG